MNHARGQAGLGLAAALLLGACHSASDEAKEAKSTEVPRALAGNGRAGAPGAVVDNPAATPVKDRVATLGLLNKRNNGEQDLVMKPGEARRVGNVVVKLATCEKTAPWERPPETGAFVQLYVEDRQSPAQPLAWHTVFSGWLFKNSPSLNAVEHPVYDVWIKDCAMKFPGEEEEPASSIASHKAAKPVGKSRGGAAAPPAAGAAPAEPPPPAEEPPPA